jgi:hypothetical protein
MNLLSFYVPDNDPSDETRKAKRSSFMELVILSIGLPQFKNPTLNCGYSILRYCKVGDWVGTCGRYIISLNLGYI